VGEERESPLPSCSWHYIGKRKFTSDPSVGLGFTCTPMVLVGLLLGDLAHMNMSCPNNSPSSTRLWSVLHDLVDAHTRRGTIQLEPWLRGLPFANHMCSLAKNSIPKILWEKGHGEKSMYTTLTYTCSQS
jgi:hypothetical protein